MAKLQRTTLGVAVVDTRRRVSLARLIADLAEGDQFIVSQDEDGVIHLAPATTVSKRELEVLGDAQTLKSINKGIADARQKQTTPYKGSKRGATKT